MRSLLHYAGACLCLGPFFIPCQFLFIGFISKSSLLHFSLCTSETVALSFRVRCGVVLIRFYFNLKSINWFLVPQDVSLQSENVLIEVETVLTTLQLETKGNFFPKAVSVKVFFMYLY